MVMITLLPWQREGINDKTIIEENTREPLSIKYGLQMSCLASKEFLSSTEVLCNGKKELLLHRKEE